MPPGEARPCSASDKQSNHKLSHCFSGAPRQARDISVCQSIRDPARSAWSSSVWFLIRPPECTPSLKHLGCFSCRVESRSDVTAVAHGGPDPIDTLRNRTQGRNSPRVVGLESDLLFPFSVDGECEGTRKRSLFRDVIPGNEDRVQSLIQSQAPVAEIVAAEPTADLDDVWGRTCISGQIFLRMVLAGLWHQGEGSSVRS
jgi:hypothetical protein